MQHSELQFLHATNLISFIFLPGIVNVSQSVSELRRLQGFYYQILSGKIIKNAVPRIVVLVRVTPS